MVKVKQRTCMALKGGVKPATQSKVCSTPQALQGWCRILELPFLNSKQSRP